MEINNKIKQLRHKSGLTQEQLAARLGVSAQAVSKWENAVAMPDITLLPFIAEVFGVSIDELFDLTVEQKLRRIENRLDVEEEFASDTFKEYEDFLKSQIAENKDKVCVTELLARLYHHRMESDARRVSKYAREAIMSAPEKKGCQWLLQMSEGHCVWDWNMANHSVAIDFYKKVIENDNGEPKTPMPYYYVIDNLLADHRTKEAEEYLNIYQTLPAHKPAMIPVYQAHIALAEYDVERADSIIEDAMASFADNETFLFETAQYYARRCAYEKAIKTYELSWEKGTKPRHTDALHGIAIIYEILGEYGKAVATQDRLLDCLKNEWGYSGDDRAVLEAEREKARMQKKALK